MLTIAVIVHLKASLDFWSSFATVEGPSLRVAGGSCAHFHPASVGGAHCVARASVRAKAPRLSSAQVSKNQL